MIISVEIHMSTVRHGPLQKLFLMIGLAVLVSNGFVQLALERQSILWELTNAWSSSTGRHSNTLRL